MHAPTNLPPDRLVGRLLTPEEDAIGDPDGEDDDIDDTLPGDLWFRAGPLRAPRAAAAFAVYSNAG